MNWLDVLNEAQVKAVTYGDGPLLVIAGAGSGKTRVLTYRIAYLMRERHISPFHILAVTFTNKAAREMKERLVQLVGPMAERVWMGTFHATCVQILRRHADLLGYNRSFTIFDTTDQVAAMRAVLKELNMDAKSFDPRACLGSISAAKNELLSAAEYGDRASDFWDRNVARAYEAYQTKLRVNNAMDFDDLIMLTVALFTNYPEVLAQYTDRFQYLLVDEYQDTNAAQYRLIKLLAGEQGNLCVVGDADQSIYRFRGADIRNILDFERDYPSATVIKLEQNYRSTKNILAAANHVIQNNIDRPEKTLFTHNDEGEKVLLHRADDEKGEARFIAEEIDRLRRAGTEITGITILYRTHAQSRTFEEEFIRRGLPYRIVSGVRFYERKEIKDILAYLRVVANPHDNLSLGRIVNVPKRGIGDTTVARLEDYAARHGVSLYDALAQAGSIDKINSSTAEKILRLRALIDSCVAVRDQWPLTRLTEHIINSSGYMAELVAEKTVEAEGRIENLKEFLSVTKQFETDDEADKLLEMAVSDPSDNTAATPAAVQTATTASEAVSDSKLLAFLEHVALVSDVDAYDEVAEAVTMMTLHSAKGLEFPVVFLVGMEDGVFPHSRALWDSAELEEERRLAYVGMTRAKERLYLTCAKHRMLYGQSTWGEVSRFVSEVPQELIRDLNEEHKHGLAAAHERLVKMGLGAHVGWERPGATAPGRVPVAGIAGTNGREDDAPVQPAVSFVVGERVQHDKFGAGTVVQVQATKGDQILTIAFPGEGVKKLMAGLAPLTKIE